jgi:hypothetical protein
MFENLFKWKKKEVVVEAEPVIEPKKMHRFYGGRIHKTKVYKNRY